MIHGQAELTKSKFEQQEAPKPSKDNVALMRATQGSLTGIVSFIKLSNGHYHVLSRFEDDTWEFPASHFPSGTKKTQRKFNFTTIANDSMKAMAKWCVWCKLSRGVAASSLGIALSNIKSFFAWISASETLTQQGLNAFSAQAYVAHVDEIKIKRKGQLKPLSKGTKTQRFLALETLYQHCNAFDFVKEHPWHESSACEQAKLVGKARQDSRNKAKTPIIPDEVLLPLCRYTSDFLDRANELLDLRYKLDKFEATGKSAQHQRAQKRKYLQSLSAEFDKLDEFNEALLLLRDSCIFWLLLTTGMRIHEIVGIKRGAYRTESKDGETYYYIESVSDKTHTGLAEWIAPQRAVDALKILGRYSEPLQARVERDLAEAKANNNHAEVERLEEVSGKVCLAHSLLTSEITVLSTTAITNVRLPNLCDINNVDWNLSSHQFRRTFANYVVHSELGDLRALKDHFKHWSITMTILYAQNDGLDYELFEEMLRERYWVEEQIKSDWFDLDSPITGGAIAERIMQVRGDEEHIKAFKTRKDMVNAYSSNIPIRSTGIGWCTNDDDGCMGGKCDECEHGIVDKNNLNHWEGMLIQQVKLSEVDDIGESGKAAVAKGMERCERVLTSLGVDVENMKDEICNNIQAA